MHRTLSRSFTSSGESTTIRLWPRRVLLDHSLSLWHPFGTRLTIDSVRQVAETMSKTITVSSKNGFSILENTWLNASNTILHWKKQDAELLFSYYILLMQILEKNAHTNKETASGGERLSQFIVFLFAQLYHHTDASLRKSQKLLDAGPDGQNGVKAALLSQQNNDKAHEQNEAAPISPSKNTEQSKSSTNTSKVPSLTVDTGNSSDSINNFSPKSSSSSSSISLSPSSNTTSPNSSNSNNTTSTRSVAIQSRAEDDAEHLMFVEDHLEVLMNTLRTCFPFNGTAADTETKTEDDRLSDAAMSGVELLLSGPDTFAVRARGSTESTESNGSNTNANAANANKKDETLLTFIREHLVVCEPLSSELHHTPTLDMHGYQRTTLIQTSTCMSKVTEGEVTRETMTPSISASTTTTTTTTTTTSNAVTMDTEETAAVLPPLQDVHVADCHNSFVYVLLPVRFAVIQSCTDCTIVIGACQGVISLERCVRVNVVCCGRQLRVSNCIDCTVHSYTPCSPVLLGDNRGLIFAPYSGFYHELPNHLKRTDLNTQDGLPLKNLWNSIINLDVDSSTEGSVSTSASTSYKLMDPNEFFSFEIPTLSNEQEEEGDIEKEKLAALKCLPPTPQEYSMVLQQKVRRRRKEKHKKKKSFALFLIFLFLSVQYISDFVLLFILFFD